MRTAFIVCPTCHKRKVLKFATENIRTYTETTIYEKCLECRKLPEPPEQKLLKAIFGEPL